MLDLLNFDVNSENDMQKLRIHMIEMSSNNYTYIHGQVDPTIAETLEKLEKEKK